MQVYMLQNMNLYGDNRIIKYIFLAVPLTVPV